MYGVQYVRVLQPFPQEKASAVTLVRASPDYGYTDFPHLKYTPTYP